MRQLSLRFVTPADFPAIAALTNLYIRTTSVHFSYCEVTTDELLQQWRPKEDTHPWLCAESAGRFAGFAKAGVWRTRDAYQWTAETSLYVEPEFQGRGHGKVLYSRLIALLRAQGFHSLVAGVTLPNPASVRLHETLGFVPAGVVQDAGYKFERWHAVGFWQLRLDAGERPAPLRPAAAVWPGVTPA